MLSRSPVPSVIGTRASTHQPARPQPPANSYKSHQGRRAKWRTRLQIVGAGGHAAKAAGFDGVALASCHVTNLPRKVARPARIELAAPRLGVERSRWLLV